MTYPPSWPSCGCGKPFSNGLLHLFRLLDQQLLSILGDA